MSVEEEIEHRRQLIRRLEEIAKARGVPRPGALMWLTTRQLEDLTRKFEKGEKYMPQKNPIVRGTTCPKCGGKRVSLKTGWIDKAGSREYATYYECHRCGAKWAKNPIVARTKSKEEFEKAVRVLHDRSIPFKVEYRFRYWWFSSPKPESLQKALKEAGLKMRNPRTETTDAAKVFADNLMIALRTPLTTEKAVIEFCRPFGFIPIGPSRKPTKAQLKRWASYKAVAGDPFKISEKERKRLARKGMIV